MKVYIDIGSYDGYEMKNALEDGYEVHAFEPNPEMKKYLAPYENIAYINYSAAWSEDGEMPFYARSVNEIDNHDKDQGRTLVREKSNINKESFDMVKTINIGRYLKNLDKDIDILKIDTEGGEYVILESILDNFDTKRIKTWKAEDHGDRIPSPEWHLHKEKVLNRLNSLGIVVEDWNNGGKY